MTDQPKNPATKKLPVFVVKQDGDDPSLTRLHHRNEAGELQDVSHFVLGMHIHVTPDKPFPQLIIETMANWEEMIVEGEVVTIQAWRQQFDRLTRLTVSEEIMKASERLPNASAPIYAEIAERIENDTLLGDQVPS